MRVTWDPRKASSNLAKHGVRFSDAEIVLFDPSAITSEDVSSRNEQRFVTIGSDSIGRILVLVFSHRGEELRLISARKATRKERKQYEEGI
jgi:uncharacterized DUF497 family protein